MMNNRVNKLRTKLKEKDIDAILITQAENRYYLSGFLGSAGYLIISQDKAVLATDFRYTEQAASQAPDFEILEIKNGIDKWLPPLLAEFKVEKLGFESSHVSHALFKLISDALAGEKCRFLIAASQMVEELRAVKEPQELENIRRAASISDRAIAFAETILHEGMSELKLAWEIERYMREHGSEKLPFDVIVASGVNAALPHHRPSEKLIGRSEPVVIDIGARVNGYCSDITRTLCLKPDAMFDKIYGAVLDGQLAAMAIIEEGISGKDADAAARNVIKTAGYGDAFGHSLGHGVGLNEHELPRLSASSEDVLCENMAFTVEPGIYISGWGGVRIEDLVCIEKGEINIISKARKG